MNSRHALIIDDEPDIRELLEITLQRMEVSCVAVGNLASAYQALASQSFDLCLADLRLPDGDGLDLVRHIGSHHPQLPVAVITAHGNMETAIEALKSGAFDFIAKPVQLPTLRKLVHSALQLNQRPASDTPEDGRGPAGSRLLGKSTAIEQIRVLIGKVARSQAPVFIGGESGTGKELAARMIHEGGPRAEAPFVAVNCGAIPADLIESELFGHVRGSFTGAVKDREGLFQSANGGTLFLDEVADLPLSMQVKLLRVLQEKAVRPVGASSETPVDVRIISASHKNLDELIHNGVLRHDLYYRIKVIELIMPPLRERREDIPPLIEHFLNRWGRQAGVSPPTLDEDAMTALVKHGFPGNVRELENLLERAATLSEGHHIQAEDLGLTEPFRPNTGTRMDDDSLDLEDCLAREERRLIESALEKTRWNRTEAARQLGLTLRSLRYRMAKLGL